MKITFESSLLTLAVIITGCAGEQSQANLSEKPVPVLNNEFVDLGHGRLHFRVVRGGLPVIVLESGGGLDSTQWTNLQTEIARQTGLAVVSYDRPGFGESELPLSAYDAVQEMQQLRDGLARLGLDRQVILVGHSYGAFLNQIYASKFPKDVRGLVLVDPNTVEFVDSAGGARELTKDFQYDGPKPPPKPVEATKRQIAAFQMTVETVRRAAYPAGIPMVVIAAENPGWPTDERNRLFRVAQENIVAGNQNRSLVIAEGSGHIVTADRPDVVLSAIENIAIDIRKQDSSSKLKLGD